jgi:CspA family cold shock protein
MASGKIKWFNNKQGFGFIIADSGEEVFLHHSAAPGSDFKYFDEGDRVLFEITQTERGLKATNVQRTERAQRRCG